MPGLGFLGKHEAFFMPGEKHSYRIGCCSVRHSVDPDGQIPGVNHYQLEVTLLARTKDSTRGVDHLTNAHFFRPEAFIIDHHRVPSISAPLSFYSNATICYKQCSLLKNILTKLISQGDTFLHNHCVI